MHFLLLQRAETANFGEVLSAAGCEKAADFVNFCDAFSIPVLSLTDVAGYAASKCEEKKIAKAAAKLTYAFAGATVPKVNVVIGKAFGSAYTVMNSKAIGADITYAWPDAKIGTMDAKLAAKIICDGQDAAAIDACAAEYADQRRERSTERLCRSDHRSSRHQKICDRCIRDAVHQTGGRSCQKARHSLRKEAVSYEKIFAAVRYGDLPDRYSRVRQSRPGAGKPAADR